MKEIRTDLLKVELPKQSGRQLDFPTRLKWGKFLCRHFAMMKLKSDTPDRIAE